MKTSVQLKQERSEVSGKIDALKAKAESESRAFTEAEETELSNLMKQEDALTRSIETTLELEKREAKKAANNGFAPLDNNNEDKEEKEMRGFSLTKMVKEYSERGHSGITGLEKELIAESEKEARRLGVTSSGIYLSNKVMDASYRKADKEQRTMTAGTGSAGGYFIPTEKLGFFDALYALTVLDKLGVTSLTGLAANTDLPGFSVAVTAGWASETGSQSTADATVVNRTLRPKLLYAATDVSKQLIIQTNASIDAYILGSMMKSMAVAFENAVINGDGSNKPTGILGTSGIQDVAGGTNGLALSYANVLALISAVGQANADLGNAKFLTNFKVAQQAKQTKVDSGSGGMVMGYNGLFTSLPNVIDAYPVALTSNVPSTLTKGSSGAVCSALIFGDFSQVVTGQFGGVEIMIDTTSAAIVRSGKVGITVNQFVDSAVRQPAALGAIQDILA